MKKPQPPAMRRLFWDIESAPNVVLSWRTGFKLSIGPDNIIRERAIIAIGYKWEGDKKATVLTWDKNQDDRAMLIEFAKVMAGADEMVGHNIDKFDLPWVKTRCMFHGLPPLPNVKTADTLAWARRRFYFNSNKLDYVAEFLGLGGKIKTEFGLWKSILLDKCPVSLAKMVKYCAYDVELLERVWQKLMLVSPVKTHAGVLAGHDKWTCAGCASDKVVKVRRYITAAGTEQRQMRCRDCGRYYNISKTACETYEKSRTVKA